MDGLSLWRQQFYRNVKFCDFLVFMNKGPLHFLNFFLYRQKHLPKNGPTNLKNKSGTLEGFDKF